MFDLQSFLCYEINEYADDMALAGLFHKISDISAYVVQVSKPEEWSKFSSLMLEKQKELIRLNIDTVWPNCETFNCT